MDAIVKMYGNFILEGIAVICLALFLFGDSEKFEQGGVLDILGNRLVIEEKKYDSYTDFGEIYKQESCKSAPKIEYVSGAQVTGIVNMAQVVRAIDYDGNEIKIVVLSIKSMDGEELIESYNSDTSEIILERAGVYTIELKAIDDGNRTTKCVIRMPVNGVMIQEEED